MSSSGWHIGVIGGSAEDAGIAFDSAQEIVVKSPFGEPSGPVTTGMLGGVRFTFLARHGEGHRLPPASVNYRANIDVLKRCGVTDVLALSSVVSLREDLAGGQMVAIDQFIDQTGGRSGSFFGTGLVGHVDLADPVCPRLSALVVASGTQVQAGGCYVAIDGPQLPTRAERQVFQSWGGAVVGMTAMPEARLAREAELPYALLALVTPDANAQAARDLISQLASLLPPRREPSPIDRALDNAIVTAPSARDLRLVAMLDAVAGRVLG
ncbi:MAG: S-methyl-5'-thioadenosine phosphorylase [Novosphingobium sp.]